MISCGQIAPGRFRYGEESFNVALFDIGAADLIEPPTLYSINDVLVEMEVEGDTCFIAPN